MSTIEPDVIEGGSKMEGNSIYGIVSFVGRDLVLLAAIQVVCPLSEEQLRQRRPCRRSVTPPTSARI